MKTIENTQLDLILNSEDFNLMFDFETEKNRKDFIAFVDEHDKRRGTNFLETFPEMKNFYSNVKN
jgi:hypothetical protein